MTVKNSFFKVLSVGALAGIIPCLSFKTSNLTVNNNPTINVNRNNVLNLNNTSKSSYKDNSTYYINNIEKQDLSNSLKFTYNPTNLTSANMLFDSSVTTSNYTVKSAAEYKKEKEDSQAVFEENYITDEGTWEDGGKFVFSLITNIGMITIGAVSDNPAVIVSGVAGLLGTLCENFTSKGATIQNVMDQLKETDRKIDELGAKLEQNTQQLADEIVRTEALVDQSNLNTLNLAINDFATNSIGKINSFNRNLADEVSNYYKEFVKSTQTISLVLEKDSKTNKYKSSSLSDLTDTPNYNFSITISDFTNSKNNLVKTNNIVESGFMDELSLDIDNAISKKNDLPEGIDKSDLNGFIQAMIYEQFMKKYFSTNKDKAQEYRNLVIDYAERIIGASGKVSILNTYLSRLQCMYNFAGEIKPLVRTLACNLLKVLDMNVARAAEASLFAEYSYTELEKDYKSASESIKNFYKSVKDSQDSYSYITNTVLTGGFYQANYGVSYSNLGNNCKLKVNFNLDKLSLNGDKIERNKEDFENHKSISQIQHGRISTRWTLLSSIGSSNPHYDYINYLVANDVIPQNSLDTYQYILSKKETTESSYKILTNDRKVRDLNNSDSNTELKCEGRGNPEADHFGLNKTYKYRGHDEASCWYGKTYEGTFVDARNGDSLGTQKLATWARYAESHWYWYDDEYWAFTNDSKNNYFFMVDSLA